MIKLTYFYLFIFILSFHFISAEIFPEPFIKNGNVDVAIVVGNNAPIRDIVASTNMGSSLAAYLSSHGGGDLGMITYLDSELSQVGNKNLIVISSSCSNILASRLLGKDATPLCGSDYISRTGINSGQAMIEIFNNPEYTGKIAMLITAYDPSDIDQTINYINSHEISTNIGTKIIVGSPTCMTKCLGKQCGEDGCGGICGSCEQSQNCQNGLCANIESNKDSVIDTSLDKKSLEENTQTYFLGLSKNKLIIYGAILIIILIALLFFFKHRRGGGYKMKFCDKCGEKINSKDKFCDKCGSRL